MVTETGKAATAHAKPTLRTLRIETHSRVQFKDVTAQIQKLIGDSGVLSGQCIIFVPHTTAAVLVNENDDPNLQADLDAFLKKLAPAGADYHHSDGNCDAHLKASVIGASKTLLIDQGRPALGRWQGVFLCEFDGPRRRDLLVKIISD
jgi:secondary thiamine-phosphate synthase enzyme